LTVPPQTAERGKRSASLASAVSARIRFIRGSVFGVPAGYDQILCRIDHSLKSFEIKNLMLFLQFKLFTLRMVFE
jgi:hypothetical protein